VYGEEKIFCAGSTRAAEAKQKSLVQHDKPNEPTKKGSLSFVLFESPFTSVSTISRGHPSLVSLDRTNAGLKMLRDEKKYFYFPAIYTFLIINNLTLYIFEKIVNTYGSYNLQTKMDEITYFNDERTLQQSWVFNVSILRHSGLREAAGEAVLNKYTRGRKD
jgi:hypothetical protein